jgi:curved DNA-binding protein CbpA
MNRPTPDYYQMLGLDPTATPEEIKKRYRELARRYHPDVNPDPAAGQKIKAVNEAYHVLNDPDRRSLYDAHRILSQPSAARSSGASRPAEPPKGTSSSGGAPPPRPQASRPADGARTAGTGPSRPYPEGRAGFNGFGRTPPDDAPPRSAPHAQSASTGQQSAPGGPSSARKPGGREAPSKSAVINALLSEAQLAFVNRRYKEAEALCGQALEMDQRNATIYELLGDIYARKGQTERATTAYSYAIQFNPRNYSIHSKLDRMIGRQGVAETGPTMTRPVAVPRPNWGGLADTHRDLSLMLSSILMVIAFVGVLLVFRSNPGEAMARGLPWLTMLSPNMLATSLLGGLVVGMLLAFYGGMRPISEEMVRHEGKQTADKRSGPISLVVLLGLFSIVLFYLSAAVFVGIGMIYGNLSRSLLRAYLATGALVGLFCFIASEVNALFGTVPVALFVGNLVFPAVLAGWAIGDRVRLRGRA